MSDQFKKIEKGEAQDPVGQIGLLDLTNRFVRFVRGKQKKKILRKKRRSRKKRKKRLNENKRKVTKVHAHLVKKCRITRSSGPNWPAGSTDAKDALLAQEIIKMLWAMEKKKSQH